MKNRTCPNCGYQYSFFNYCGKSLFRTSDSTWHCPNCKKVLSFTKKSRFITILGSMLPVLFNSLIFDLLKDVGLNIFLSWTAFILFSVIWIFVLCGFEKLSVDKECKTYTQKRTVGR